ncbi:N-acetyl-alpha-D-glucosaminyl L-malate synthase [Methanosarcinales archaeon]|nr:N-acetyl-alpha-D-glucosaminyl L-malate synthase [Methanosarcinales archaeon]
MNPKVPNNTKKNLVFFLETRYIGGAEVYLLLLASGLDKKLFNIRVAIPKSNGTSEFVNELRSKGIKVDFIKKYNILNNFLYFNKIKPDYIHFNVPIPSINSCTTAILAGIMYSKSKLYVTEHMVPPEYEPQSFIRSIIRLITISIIRLLYAKLEMSITVSNKNKESLMKNYKLPKNKIKVIYNCIDIEHITNYNRDIARELKKQFLISDSAIVFGTIGRLSPQKGHEYLINASKIVIKEIPQSLFLFVGKGENKDQLIQKINDYNLSEYYRLVGYQENLSDIFTLIDIFVLPSISEGFPFVILEAMAANKPVIATNVGGIPEIITNNINGILVESRDPDALAKAMIMLAKDTKKRNHIAEMGCKKIRENFSLEKMILATKEIYK